VLHLLVVAGEGYSNVCERRSVQIYVVSEVHTT
jgi:hypothetical protein